MNEALDLLFFLMRGRRCAIDASSVRQVVAAPLVTPVPLVPSLVRGALSFHGLPLAVIDLGVDLLPGSLDSTAPHAELTMRSGLECVLIVEAHLPSDGVFVRAALSVERVVRIVSVPSDLFRPHQGLPAFVTATVADSEGSALLIDVAIALESTMNTIRQGRHAA